MAQFKFKTSKGSFSLKLEHEPSPQEFREIAQIAYNLVGEGGTQDWNNSNSIAITNRQGGSIGKLVHGQRQLGERPVEEIKLGDYQEPETGLYIHILAMPPYGSVAGVIKKLRPIASISAVGWKELLLGNYTKVKFEPSVAMEILRVLKDEGIFAKAANEPMKIVERIEGGNKTTALDQAILKTLHKKTG